ncbi:MAG: nucleoside recognition domain-containing protein [Acidobacteriota bacterium]|nr:nucleoside recognition domain-containing protein [Acidobacteriota bacterium]MDQ7086653.1 nucleoside recognition domain-containing protein [Acidobacteriota bacterium]
MGPVFILLLLVAVCVGLLTGRIEAVSRASVESAQSAVTLAIGLVGMMSFWLGMVEVLSRAGLLGGLARSLRPLFRRLFPEIPDGHPALAAITMNIAANMMGLVNAATPFGIAAMRQLDRLNTRKGTATDPMCLFLAINTSAVAVFPTGVIAARAALGSKDPAGIVITTLLATALSTLAAVVACLLLARLPFFSASRPPLVQGGGDDPAAGEADDEGIVSAPPAKWSFPRLVIAAAVLLVAIACGAWGFASLARSGLAPHEFRVALSATVLPGIILVVVLAGWSRRVDVYAAVVEGGREGFQVALRIIPYMVAILVGVGMFRASGALDALVGLIDPLTRALALPAEALPMALLRPLSGSGAYAVMAEIMKTHGADSAIGYLVSTMQGSTETTFYVLAVYGGEVGLRRTRHAIPACLVGDLFGVLGAVLACRWWLG